MCTCASLHTQDCMHCVHDIACMSTVKCLCVEVYEGLFAGGGMLQCHSKVQTSCIWSTQKLRRYDSIPPGFLLNELFGDHFWGYYLAQMLYMYIAVSFHCAQALAWRGEMKGITHCLRTHEVCWSHLQPAYCPPTLKLWQILVIMLQDSLWSTLRLF